MANNTIIINVDTSNLDEAIKKAKELEETLKRAKQLTQTLLSQEQA